MESEMSIEWSFPGTALHRIFEYIARTGDGRVLGKASCVATQWRDGVNDRHWKEACICAEHQRQRHLFAVDPYQPMVNLNQTRIYRAQGYRGHRESYFSADGTASSAEAPILRFAAVLARGEVDQIVLQPESYFQHAISVSSSSSEQEKAMAVASVRDWARQIRRERYLQPETEIAPLWGAQPAGWRAFDSAIRAITPLLIDVINDADRSISPQAALDVLNALGYVAPSYGGDMIARRLLNESAIIPALCSFFARSLTTPDSGKVIACLTCLCCGVENSSPEFRNDKSVTLDALHRLVACGFLDTVQAALAQGDACAGNAIKLGAWIRSVLPHAADDLSREPMACVRLISQTMSAAPEAAWQSPWSTETGGADAERVGAVHVQCKRLLDTLCGALSPLHATDDEEEDDAHAKQTIARRVAHAGLPVLAKYCHQSLPSECCEAVSSLILLTGLDDIEQELQTFSPNFLVAVVHNLSRDSFAVEEVWPRGVQIVQGFCAWLQTILRPAVAFRVRLMVRTVRDLFRMLSRARDLAIGDREPQPVLEESETIEQSLTSFLFPGAAAAAGDFSSVSEEEAKAAADSLMELHQASLHPGPGMTQLDHKLLKLSLALVSEEQTMLTAMLQRGLLAPLFQMSVEGNFFGDAAEIVRLMMAHDKAEVVGSAARALPGGLLARVFEVNAQRLHTQMGSPAAMEENHKQLLMLGAAASCFELRGAEESDRRLQPTLRELLHKLRDIDTALRVNQIAAGGEEWARLFGGSLPSVTRALLPIALRSLRKIEITDEWWGGLWQRTITPRLLVGVMSKYESNARVQLGGCRLMHAMVDFRDIDDPHLDVAQAAGRLVAAGAIPACVAACRAHSGDFDVFSAVCSALIAMLTVDESEQDEAVRGPVVEAGGVDAIRDCARALGMDNPEVAAMTLRVLGQVGECYHGSLAVGRDEVLQEVMAAMETHREDLGVQQFGCGLLFNVVNILISIAGSENDGHPAMIVQQAGGIEMAIAAMQRFPHSDDLQQKACGVLRACGYHDVSAVADGFGRAQTLFELNGGPQVLDAMRRARDHEEVQLQGLLFMLDRGCTDEAAVASLMAQGGVVEVLEVLRRHRRSSNMNVVAFSLLQRVLSVGGHEGRTAKSRSVVEMGGIEELVNSIWSWCSADVEPNGRQKVHSAAASVLVLLLERDVGGQARFNSREGGQVIATAARLHLQDAAEESPRDEALIATLTSLLTLAQGNVGT